MASISWVNVGEWMSGRYTETETSNVLRTQYERGDIKQVRRSALRRKEYSITFLFTSAEFTTFKTWYEDTALDGALKFDYLDPVTNTTREYRIKGGGYSAQPVSPSCTHWYVSMTWETTD